MTAQATTVVVGTGIETVLTVDAGGNATLLNVGAGEATEVTFAGVAGPPGPAATVAVGTVTTVDPTDPATVTNAGTSSAAVFDFEIPKGEDGPAGASAQREARSDWVAPNSYMGIAAQGASESAAVWKVTRVTVSGSSVTVAKASPIRWTDRLTAVYS